MFFHIILTDVNPRLMRHCPDLMAIHDSVWWNFVYTLISLIWQTTRENFHLSRQYLQMLSPAHRSALTESIYLYLSSNTEIRSWFVQSLCILNEQTRPRSPAVVVKRTSLQHKLKCHFNTDFISYLAIIWMVTKFCNFTLHWRYKNELNSI